MSPAVRQPPQQGEAMQPLFLHAVGICLPGLPDWATARAVLQGEHGYQPAGIVAPASSLLPANERRRAPLAVRVAFRAAEDAVTGFGLAAADWAGVFATSDADTPIIHRIGTALAEPQRIISPIDFHNCVHNAAAGYWSIAVGARRSSTSLSAYDASFAAGLLEAVATVVCDGEQVLLVAYDIPPPPTLFAKRPIDVAGGVALALSGAADGALARLELQLQAGSMDATPTPCEDAALEVLRLGNPAARALPLLALVAAAAAGSVLVELPAGLLRVAVVPA